MHHSSSLLTPAQSLLRALCPAAKPRLRCNHTPETFRLSFNNNPRRFYKPVFVSRNRVASINGSVNTPYGDSNFRSQGLKLDPLRDYIKDEDIEASQVQVVQPDGKLGPVQYLNFTLHGLNRDEEHLVQVGKIDDDPTGPIAVVKVYQKAELMKQKLEKAKLAREQKKAVRDKAPKQIELNWAIGQHDLELKLGQLESFLEKGKTVEVILAPKKKQRRATREEGEAVLDQIREKLVQVGGKEVRPMEGEVLKQAILTISKKGQD